MLCVGHVKPNPEWHLSAHIHDFHELIVVFSGQIHVSIDGRALTGKAGDVLFYPKGVTHEETSNKYDPVETYFVEFDDADFEPGLAPTPPPRSHDSSGRIRLLISWLYADRDLCANVEQKTPRAFLQTIFAELHRINYGVENQFLALMRRFIHERIEQPLTLEDLARHAGMSKYHFLRKYKEIAGRPPMQDLVILRLEHASKLIVTTGLPLKSIAPMSGLSNEYHLSRLFRKHLKIAPSQLRKMALREEQ